MVAEGEDFNLAKGAEPQGAAELQVSSSQGWGWAVPGVLQSMAACPTVPSQHFWQLTGKSWACSGKLMNKWHPHHNS